MARFLNFRYLLITLILFLAVQKIIPPGPYDFWVGTTSIIFFVILTMFKDMLY